MHNFSPHFKTAFFVNYQMFYLHPDLHLHTLKVFWHKNCNISSEKKNHFLRILQQEKGNIMVQKKALVKNPTGLHARPAAQLVNLCRKFKSSIYIELNERKCNAKSIFELLHTNVKMGDKITVIADGEDEASALEQVVDFIEALEE